MNEIYQNIKKYILQAKYDIDHNFIYKTGGLDTLRMK